MMKNIELKARVRNVEALRSRIEHIGGQFVAEFQQTDTYLAVATGMMKVRIQSDGICELIAYRRRTSLLPRPSRYRRYKLGSIVDASALIQKRTTIRVISKKRRLYMLGLTRVHLDVVEELGQYLEFEHPISTSESTCLGEEVVRKLCVALGIEDELIAPTSYLEIRSD